LRTGSNKDSLFAPASSSAPRPTCGPPSRQTRSRRDLDPSKLLVQFLAGEPPADVRERVLRIESEPEELRMEGRELYIYYPNGMARPKVSWTFIEKTLQTQCTGRNWNTVRKLLEMAESLDAC
jgi:uncharacterized protein (DUF1697 family)